VRLASEVQYNYAVLVVKATFAPQEGGDRSDLKAKFDSVVTTVCDCLQSTPGIEVLENGGEHAMPRSTVGIDQSSQGKDPLWLYERHSTVNLTTGGNSTHRVKTAPLLRGIMSRHPATGEGSSFNSMNSLSTAEGSLLENERPSTSSSSDNNNGASSSDDEDESESEDENGDGEEEEEEAGAGDKGEDEGLTPTQPANDLDGVDLLTAPADDAYPISGDVSDDTGGAVASGTMNADNTAANAGEVRRLEQDGQAKVSGQSKARSSNAGGNSTKKSKKKGLKPSPKQPKQSPQNKDETHAEFFELWAPTAVLSGSQVQLSS